ncbi:MAG: hypothetical protein KGZ54_03540 [Dethiobacter sp.]|nr:hypothetical protein [Dethiobacter sp.]MBS3901079.1 hypothetical protein [Dethiobacter sp.]MBS3988893.1 hypothetical protein [Dethiobacter sp.]
MSTVAARIVAASPAGLTAQVGGVLGHVPLADIPALLHPLTAQLVGQQIPVTVAGRGSPIRYSYTRGLAAQSPLPAGQVGTGTVRAMGRKHLYVEAGSDICAIPQSRATLSRVATLSDLYHLGQAVSLIDGSIVGAQPSPWLNLGLPRGATVCGIVVDVLTKDTRPTVLIEIIPGVIGISDMPLSAQLRRGDKVSGKVIRFDAARQRMRITITHANGRTLPSPAAAGLIGLLQAYGPLPVAAAELIHPDALTLARRARGAIAVRDLGGEPGFWPTAQVGLSPASRQQAWGWFAARAIEAGCQLERATGWVLTTPRGRQAHITILPDPPPPAGGISIVPDGAEALPGRLSISAAQLRIYPLADILSSSSGLQ